MIFPSLNIKALIVVTEGSVGLKNFPPYATIWVTKDLDDEELIEKIANLDLFITNDSGPMHLGAAFGVPTVCIFGPTKFIETSQWQNEKSVIVKKEFGCMPCMKRECPLGGEEYHQCMKSIYANDVLEKVKEIN